VRLRVFNAVEFNCDSIDLIFKLSWPVQIFSVRLYEQNLAFEDAYFIDSLLMVIRKIDDFMIEVFIVLMPLDDANRRALIINGLSSFLSLCLDHLLNFLHFGVSVNGNPIL
jgi:hypothetical protein